MQTFMPVRSFSGSAFHLDSKRLGKQRVECKQILIALGVGVGQHQGNRGSSWRNHPAVRMWRGYEVALCEYSTAVCNEWRRRGFADVLMPQFIESRHNILCDARFGPDNPAWLGMDEFHASHRSNLLRKMPAFYSKFGWSEPDDLPYFWPDGREIGLVSTAEGGGYGVR